MVLYFPLLMGAYLIERLYPNLIQAQKMCSSLSLGSNTMPIKKFVINHIWEICLFHSEISIFQALQNGSGSYLLIKHNSAESIQARTFFVF